MEPANARVAIQAALSADWETAINANLLLLKENPEDIDALMRLSHAYLATGNFKSAKKLAKQVTQIDPSNTLAQKCLIKCTSLENGKHTVSFGKVSLDNFLEEPGRTKTVTLNHLGTPKTIASLIPGEKLIVATTKRQASIQNEREAHVGHIPDDVAAWIIHHKKLGDGITAYVKSASAQTVIILLKLKNSSTLLA